MADLCVLFCLCFCVSVLLVVCNFVRCLVLWEKVIVFFHSSLVRFEVTNAFHGLPLVHLLSRCQKRRVNKKSDRTKFDFPERLKTTKNA